MRAGHERGAASIYVLAATLVVLALAGAAAVFARLLVAHARAGGAADLAALAAAARALDGESSACARARDVAAANDADLVRCRLQLGVATVTVRVDLGPGLGRFGEARSESRAGPVRQPG